MSTTNADAAATAAASPATSAKKPLDVHHSLKGPVRPKSGQQDSLAKRLEELVEGTRHNHESHVGMSDVGGMTTSSDGKQRKTLDRLSSYFKTLGCNVIPDTDKMHHEFASWKMGNYVALRKVGPGGEPEKFFESMPIYVRIGMHLLFYGSTKKSLLRFGSVEKLLKKMSEREGKIYDDSSEPAEVQAFIKNFVATYSIDTTDLLEPDLTTYKTRNEFFYRKLKPDVRPIAERDNDAVVAPAADCRLMLFDNAAEAKQIWIKGRSFSVKELVNKVGGSENILSEDSSLAIYRLAPADYHRYHHPIGPVKVDSRLHAGQEYYTVNPEAVGEDFDVFTANSRDVTMLSWTSKKEGKNAFKIAFVSIGAMLVGSNRFTNGDVGSAYTRGQEMGYFAYGGSTCIAVFPPEAKIKWDADIRVNSVKGLETLVKVNERIGISEA